MSDEIKTYDCPECGLPYRNELAAIACEAWCKKHKSCNLEITQFALEHKEDTHG